MAHWAHQTQKFNRPHLTNFREPKTIFLKCDCNENSGSNDFLGFTELFNKQNTFFQRLFWFLALVVSISLCIWQVTICVEKYISKPIGTNIAIEVFDQQKFPSVTVCPSTNKFGHEFDPTFEKFCSATPDCKNASEDEKFKFPFTKLNTNIMEMWLAKEVQEIRGRAKCSYSVEPSACREVQEVKYEDNYIDTVIGRCQTLRSDLKWYYMGNSAWTWWIEVLKLDYSLSKYEAFGTDMIIHTTPSLTKMLISDQILAKYYANLVGLSKIEFVHLDSREKPCSSEENVVRCLNKCVDEKFHRSNAVCKWPFLKSDLRYCNSQEENEKLRQLLVHLNSHTSSCNCKRPCVSVTYMTTITRQESSFNVLHNITSVGFVWLQNTKQTVTEFYSYPFIALLTDLGGSIGLFLGICLLTILELFYSGCGRFL